MMNHGELVYQTLNKDLHSVVGRGASSTLMQDIATGYVSLMPSFIHSLF